MPDTTQLVGVVPIYPTNDMKAHDLTMLYLKHQDLTKMTVSEISKKYKDVSREFTDLLK